MLWVLSVLLESIFKSFELNCIDSSFAEALPRGGFICGFAKRDCDGQLIEAVEFTPEMGLPETQRILRGIQRTVRTQYRTPSLLRG